VSEDKELPKGWVTVRIQDIAPAGGTRNPNGEGEFLYVDIEAVDNVSQKIVAPKRILKSAAPSRARMAIQSGDVIFSLVRPYLKNIAIVPQELDGQIASTAYCVMRPSPGTESSFIFYTLLQESFINSITTYGNSPPSAHDDEFLAMKIVLAPTNEQHRIVSAIEQQFSRLDAGVAALKRAKAKLKRYRAAVLKAAVEGKLTETWRAEHPTTEPASLLLERILKERREKWEADLRAKGKDPAKVKYVEPAAPVNENLPGLPEGWCWVTVEQVVSRSEYGTSVKCDYEAQGVPVLRIPNIAAGEIDLSDMKYSVQALNINKDNALQMGDILVCRTNGSVSLIGKAALIRSQLEPFHTFASYLLRFRLFENNILPKWFHLFLSSPQGRSFIERNAASSAGQHNISLTLMHSLVFPLPSLEEQGHIVSEVESRLSIISQLEVVVDANLKRAERLRQSILQEAFAGRLVSQDPTDEPASVLLERIRNERNGQKNGAGANDKKRRAVRVPEPVTLDAVDAKQTELWESVGN
jgi:type I restriction enzyme, S subunit